RQDNELHAHSAEVLPITTNGRGGNRQRGSLHWLWNTLTVLGAGAHSTHRDRRPGHEGARWSQRAPRRQTVSKLAGLPSASSRSELLASGLWDAACRLGVTPIGQRGRARQVDPRCDQLAEGGQARLLEHGLGVAGLPLRRRIALCHVGL